MKLGALVISHNSAAELPACLKALERFLEDFQAGIVVIDNASTDGSVAAAAAAPHAKLIALGQNLGFAGAVNLGFDALQDAEAVLILNPDCVISCSPAVLAAELEAPETGAAAGQLIGESGTPQVGFQVRRFPTPWALTFEILGINRIWPSNPVNRHWRALDLQLDSPTFVEQPAGACLLVSRRCWLALGGFDEGFYPAWFEDVDFLRRAHAAGWRTRFHPRFSAFHRGGHSVSKVSWARRQLYWYGGLLRYANRHFSPAGKRFVSAAVMAGLAPRLVMGIFTDRPSQALEVCGKVMRLAFSYLLTADSEPPRRTDRRAAIENCGPLGSPWGQEGNRH